MFKPALQYLKAEQFDAARTNTNYITRIVNLKKKIDSLIVLANDVVDDVDEASFSLALSHAGTYRAWWLCPRVRQLDGGAGFSLHSTTTMYELNCRCMRPCVVWVGLSMGEFFAVYVLQA